MKRKTFVVVLTQDEEEPKILNVTVPALPGCFTWGWGRRDALRNAKEAIEGFLEATDGEDIGVGSEAAEIEVAA